MDALARVDVDGKDFAVALGAMIKQYGDCLDVTSCAIEADTCTTVVQLLRQRCASPTVAVLEGIKIMTRFRHGLDLLLEADFFQQMLGLEEAALLNQSLRILVNLGTLHQTRTVALLKEVRAHERVLQIIQTHGSSLHLDFVCFRLVLFCALDETAAAYLSKHLFPIAIDYVLQLSTPGFQDDAEKHALLTEVLKAMFIIHSSSPYAGDKSTLIDRVVDILAYRVHKEHIDASSRSESQSRLLRTKVQCVNLMYCESTPAPVLSENTAVLDGMLELLDVLCHEPEFAPGLPPMLLVLRGLALTSTKAQSYLKRGLFGAWADTNAASDEDTMQPAGHDASDTTSTKAVLLKHITSFNTLLKTSSSEFFFALANQESDEYVRLVGFGNAAGLLAEKGFPGFAGMQQQGIDLSHMVSK